MNASRSVRFNKERFQIKNLILIADVDFSIDKI